MFNKSAIKERKQIAHLLHKYVKGELSLKEQNRLNEWAAISEKNRELLQDVTNQQLLASDMASFSSFQWNDIAQKLEAKGLPIIEITPGRRTMYWGRFMAAAALLIMVVASYLLVQNNRKPSKIQQQEITVKQNDIPPGKYKAKLTLADGSTIILDSAKNGTLVQQNGTSIINKDGKLIYEKGNETNKVLYNTLSTSKAQTYASILSDGTKVWLNSESSIHYPVAFNEDVRKVEITGEAYFEVAPSITILANGQKVKRPFIVSAGGMDIEVLGTHFNINSYADEPAIKTTLLEGKVRVRSATNNAQTILMPGEQAVLQRGHNDNPSTSLRVTTTSLRVTKDVDVDAEVAWRFGMFQFNNDNLQMVLRQISRWYDVDVVYQGQIPKETFWGKILRNNSLSQVLETLHSSDVHFKIEGKKIIVSK